MAGVLNAIRVRVVHGEEIVLQARECPLFYELIEHDVHSGGWRRYMMGIPSIFSY